MRFLDGECGGGMEEREGWFSATAPAWQMKSYIGRETGLCLRPWSSITGGDDDPISGRADAYPVGGMLLPATRIGDGDVAATAAAATAATSAAGRTPSGAKRAARFGHAWICASPFEVGWRGAGAARAGAGEAGAAKQPSGDDPRR